LPLLSIAGQSGAEDSPNPSLGDSDESLRLRPHRLVVLWAAGVIRITGRETLGRARLADRLPNLAISIVDVLLELADAFADRRSDLRHALGAEQDEHDDQDDHQLHETDVAEIHMPSPRRATERSGRRPERQRD